MRKMRNDFSIPTLWINSYLNDFSVIDTERVFVFASFTLLTRYYATTRKVFARFEILKDFHKSNISYFQEIIIDNK